MRALAPNPFTLVDFDRYGWVDADPDPEAMERRRQRGKRRDVVNALLKTRNYWVVLRYVSEGVLKGAILPYFWSLDEAVRHFGAKLDPDRRDIDEVHACYVVARYFRAYRWHWLNTPEGIA